MMGNKNNPLHDDRSSNLPEVSGAKLEAPADHAESTISKLAVNASPSSPFLKLALELRDHIYGYVLVKDEQPVYLTRRRKSDTRPMNNAVAILATSRQVHLEARRIFLSGNAFVIYGSVDDHKWLKGLGPDGQTLLRKVIYENGIQSYTVSHYRTFNVLSACPKLSLTIEVHYGQLLNLKKMGVFKYLHGCLGATVNKYSSGEDRECTQHGFSMSDPKIDNALVDTLLNHFKSTCPKTCRMHGARDAAHYTASIHIHVDYGCPRCYDLSLCPGYNFAAGLW